MKPHEGKIEKALDNDNCEEADLRILRQIKEAYQEWRQKVEDLDCEGKEKVEKMAEYLNDYKNKVALLIVNEDDADFLRRQKGQLKLESSITEEFLMDLVDPDIMPEIEEIDDLVHGPKDVLLSISFDPSKISEAGELPVDVETKDYDFVIGTKIYYKFSNSNPFKQESTTDGEFTLSILGGECKRHLDKTMYREQVGTAGHIKDYVPFSRYYIITDFLDMAPANPETNELDNVFVLRKAKRLPYGKRKDPETVKEHLEENPIDPDVLWDFVQEARDALESQTFDPEEAYETGSFI